MEMTFVLQQLMDATTGARVPFLDETEYIRGSGHRAGQWLMGNSTGTAQWYLYCATNCRSS